ncbi:MAG: hypothetical protein R3212_04055, partial [Xanthomonadales bacterium]|nr:hypothetical protein [Xanthomonadales bacterium]
ARDIGTQFQVRLVASAMRATTMKVAVRDGLVEVEQPGQDRQEVNAGFQVTFVANGERQAEPLDIRDPEWNWIESVAPAFHMDGASLAEYLDWYAREAGVVLVWADTASQQRAAGITLTGGLDGVGLDESLAAVQRVAPFKFRREGDRLWVKVD